MLPLTKGHLSNKTYSGPSICPSMVPLFQWTTHGNKKMWSYSTGGLKIKVIEHRKLPSGTRSSSLIIKGGLKIEVRCKIEGLLYMYGKNNITYMYMYPSIQG